MDLYHRAGVDDRVHLCLPTVGHLRCRCLLVLPQTHRHAGAQRHRQTCQVPSRLGSEGFVHHHAVQDTSTDPHLFVCQVSMKRGSFERISIIVAYFFPYFRLKRHQQEGSECASCCLKCCICSFWLLEKFIRYLNHNAYTVIAIESVNFCPAAKIVSGFTIN